MSIVKIYDLYIKFCNKLKIKNCNKLKIIDLIVNKNHTYTFDFAYTLYFMLDYIIIYVLTDALK